MRKNGSCDQLLGESNVIMPDNVIYYFGRLNILSAYSDDKRSFLMKGLRPTTATVGDDLKWLVSGVEESSTEEGAFIFGTLVKYRPETSEETVRPESGTIVDMNISNAIVAKAPFFIHVSEGLIAFHPAASDISIDSFCRRFKEVFEAGHDGFFVDVEVQMIQERYNIVEILGRFSSIRSIIVHLRPSNPNSGYRWKDVDEDLQATNTARYTEIRIASSENKPLNVVGNQDVIAKLTMAEDGYGQGIIDGVLDGEQKRVTTGEDPASARAPNVSDSNRPVDVLALLSSAFRQIMRRKRQ